MNKGDRLAVTVVGYIAIGIIALPISLVASFFTWLSVLNRSTPSPGDGIGFLLVITLSVPASIAAAVLAPLLAQKAFAKPSAWPLRVGVIFLAPIVTAIVVSALVTMLTELSFRLNVSKLFF